MSIAINTILIITLILNTIDIAATRATLIIIRNISISIKKIIFFTLFVVAFVFCFCSGSLYGIGFLIINTPNYISIYFKHNILSTINLMLEIYLYSILCNHYALCLVDNVKKKSDIQIFATLHIKIEIRLKKYNNLEYIV